MHYLLNIFLLRINSFSAPPFSLVFIHCVNILYFEQGTGDGASEISTFHKNKSRDRDGHLHVNWFRKFHFTSTVDLCMRNHNRL